MMFFVRAVSALPSLMASILLLGTILVAQTTTPDASAWVRPPQGNMRLYTRDGVFEQVIPGTDAPSLTSWSKGPDGRVYAVDQLAGAVTVWDRGGQLAVQSVPNASRFFPTTNGGWALADSGNPFGGGTSLIRIDATGVVLASHVVVPSLLSIRDVVVDGSDNAWILSPLGIQKFDLAGSSFSLPSVTNASMAFVDPFGRIWAEQFGTVAAFDTATGALLGALSVPDFEVFAMDPLGRVRILTVDTQGSAALHAVDASTFSLAHSMTLNLTGLEDVVRFSYDATGQVWGASNLADTWRLPPGHDTPISVPLSAPFPLGLEIAVDAEVAALHWLNLDLDGDGFTTRIEILRGSDPMVALDAPADVQALGPLVAGQSQLLEISSPSEVGKLFFVGASAFPGVLGRPVGPFHMQSVPLGNDALLAYWLSPFNALAPNGIGGVIGPAGTGTLQIDVPLGTVGLGCEFASLSLDPLTLEPGHVSMPLSITIQ